MNNGREDEAGMSRAKAQVGIREVARESGVSPATVSRVLRGHPGVREPVRLKVLQAAEMLQYHPDLSEEGGAIAVILPELAGSSALGNYHDQLLPPLLAEIHQRGFQAVLVPLNDLSLLRRAFPVGAIACAASGEIARNWDNRFAIPLVVINNLGGRLRNAFCVSSDEEQGMRLAVAHLVRKGHRRIGLLIDGSPERTISKQRRRAGFLQALREFRCETAPGLIQNGVSEAWLEEIGRIIRAGATALICCGESSGYRVDFALNLYRKRVPEELSVISFENGCSRFCTPPHTTLSQDFRRIAFESLELLELVIRDPAQGNSRQVPYTLIERESVASRES